LDWDSYDRRIRNIGIADDSFSYFMVYGKKMNNIEANRAFLNAITNDFDL